jgi:hypothetical protein
VLPIAIAKPIRRGRVEIKGEWLLFGLDSMPGRDQDFNSYPPTTKLVPLEIRVNKHDLADLARLPPDGQFVSTLREGFFRPAYELFGFPKIRGDKLRATVGRLLAHFVPYVYSQVQRMRKSQDGAPAGFKAFFQAASRDPISRAGWQKRHAITSVTLTAYIVENFVESGWWDGVRITKPTDDPRTFANKYLYRRSRPSLTPREEERLREWCGRILVWLDPSRLKDPRFTLPKDFPHHSS